jgi:hypothetical protein
LICATFSSQDIKGCLETRAAISSRVVHGLIGWKTLRGFAACYGFVSRHGSALVCMK